MPDVAIIKIYLFVLGKKEKIKEYISKELKRARETELFTDNKSMKVRTVDNKSDATPSTTTQEISTSANNTNSSSEPNNDSAILKSYQTFVSKFESRK